MLKVIARSLLLLIASLFGASWQTPSPAPDPAGVVNDFFDAYRARDVDRMLRLMTPDVAFEDPTFRLRAHGHEEVRKMGESLRTSYSEVAIEVHTIVVSGDDVATEQTISGVLERKDGSTRRIRVRGASFFRMRGGRIAKWTDYFDFRTYSEQLGGGTNGW